MAENPRLTVVVKAELLAEFKRLAQERGHTMAWYVNQAIREIVNRSHQEEEGKGGDAVKRAGKRK